MTARRTWILALLLAIAALVAGAAAAQGPAETAPAGTEPAAPLAVMGTAFTYQGQLMDAGSPANGVYDLQFRLYDAAAGGGQVGGAQSVNNVAVAGGLFTATLDFGAGAFNGQARWLEIAVKRDAGAGYTTLAPRVAVSPAPQALALPGFYTQQTTTSTPNLIGGYSGNSVADSVYAATISGGGTGSGVNRVTDDFGTVGGGSENQAGDNAGTHYDSINATVSGGQGNRAGAAFATVSGGSHNESTGSDSTIGGGSYNEISSFEATISGGFRNTVSGNYAAIGGGTYNTADGLVATISGGGYNTAGGRDATIGGGNVNTASGEYATVGGGRDNTASASYATVPGGYRNTSAGSFSFAAGRRAKANHDGTFVWADSTDADFGATAADQFLVRASGGVGLGINAPNNQLHVAESLNQSATPANHVAQIQNTSTGDSADVLALKIGYASNPASSNNFITFFKGDNTSVGSIEGNGSGGVVLAGPGNDFAEWLPRLDPNEALEPGDIIGVVDGRISKATAGAQALLVVSSNPIVAGNAPVEGEEWRYARVAFIGQALVKVRGPVQAGDFILPSGRDDGIGVGRAPAQISLAELGQIVGRAWQSGDGAGVQQVKIVVGLPQGAELAALLAAQAAEVAALRSQLARQQAELAALRQAVERLGTVNAGAGSEALANIP